MHYRRLGHTGLKISEIGLGSWVTFGSQISEATAIDLVKAAYEQGVNSLIAPICMPMDRLRS